MPIPITFHIYEGDQLVRTETFAQDVIKIGKLDSSHLRIDDAAVSRMHSVIEVSGPGEVYIIDLGSASGTIVNGQRVNKARLSPAISSSSAAPSWWWKSVPRWPTRRRRGSDRGAAAGLSAGAGRGAQSQPPRRLPTQQQWA